MRRDSDRWDLVPRMQRRLTRLAVILMGGGELEDVHARTLEGERAAVSCRCQIDCHRSTEGRAVKLAPGASDRSRPVDRGRERLSAYNPAPGSRAAARPSDELLSDSQPQLLDRHAGIAPQRVEAVAAGVKHRGQLLVVGDRHAAMQVLRAKAL